MNKDIDKAIILEQQYLQDKLNGKTVSLIDYLINAGYSNLDEFFNDKDQKMFKDINFIYDETTLIEDIPEKVAYNIANCVPSVLIPDIYQPFAWIGKDANYSQEDFDYYNIKTYNLHYNGGIIISGPEDLSIAIIMPKIQSINSNFFLDKIDQYFFQHFDNSYVDHNDLIINDKKVMGSVSIITDKTFMFAAQFSFKDRYNVIKVLCPPHGGKIPGAIDSNIITKNDLIMEIKSWLP